MIVIRTTRRTKKVLIDITNQNGLHQKGIESALYEIGQEVVTETSKLIKTGAKTGRVYRIKGRSHQASAPGEAPANRSGRLARSGDYKVRSWDQMEVGETVGHGKFLEDGTRRRIVPRPHVIKAINNKARDAQIALLEHGRKEIGA